MPGALAALAMAGAGFPLPGAVLYAASLLALPIVLWKYAGRRSRAPTALPFSFASHWVVMGLAVVAILVLSRRFPATQGVALGCMAYHYTCIAIVEGRVSYVPWGRGFLWKTADRASRPGAYWFFVGVFAVLATMLLGLVFFAAATQ